MTSSAPKESSRLQRTGFWILTILIALLLGIAIGLIVARSAIPFPGPLGFIALWVGGYYLTLAIHETGHLLAARWVWLTPHIMFVGPVRLTWEEGRVQVRWDRTFLTGGLMIALPTGGRMLPRQMAWMTAGGPAANLISAALGLLTAFLWPDPFPGAGLWAYLPTFLFLFGFMSALQGTINLVPGQGNGFLTDGGRLLRLWQGGPKASRDAALWAMLALILAPERVREMPAELLESALRLRDSSQEELQAHAIAYDVALDKGEVAAAAAHLERAEELVQTMPQASRPALYLELCYFTARHRQEVERARVAFARTKGGVAIQPWMRRRAESALRLAEGDNARALSLAREGLELLAKKPVTGANLLERMLLEELEALASPT